MTATTAQAAGRLAGTAYAHTRRTLALIDWAEVGAIVLHGLQVLIVMTLLAGRATRRGWNALLDFSEHLGHAYAALIAPEPAATVQILVAPAVHPLMELNDQLMQRTRRELMALAGTRSKLAKAQLAAIALAV